MATNPRSRQPVPRPPILWSVPLQLVEATRSNCPKTAGLFSPRYTATAGPCPNLVSVLSPAQPAQSVTATGRARQYRPPAGCLVAVLIVGDQYLDGGVRSCGFWALVGQAGVDGESAVGLVADDQGSVVKGGSFAHADQAVAGLADRATWGAIVDDR